MTELDLHNTDSLKVAFFNHITVMLSKERLYVSIFPICDFLQVAFSKTLLAPSEDRAVTLENAPSPSYTVSLLYSILLYRPPPPSVLRKVTGAAELSSVRIAAITRMLKIARDSAPAT